MKKSNQYVVFILDDKRYALHLFAVERIVRAVEITPLPKASVKILGIINVEGRIIPVINIRKGFSLPDREIDLGDNLIIVQLPKRSVALLVDSVIGYVEIAKKNVIDSKEIMPGMKFVEGLIKIKDDLVLIYDLEKFTAFKMKKNWTMR